MDLREVASLLRISREKAKLAIEEGIKTSAGNVARLGAAVLSTGPDVSEDQLDAFIAALEEDEPGRHPPVSIRRELLIESRYRCAVCKGDGPLEFHHIVDWAVIKHHDARHMLVVCANCHAKITRHGEPDTTAQKEIKRLICRENVRPPSPAIPATSQQPEIASTWPTAKERVQSVANGLLRDALARSAEAGEQARLEVALVYLVGCYEAVRIHWVREYRLAERSDAPRLENYLPALFSPAAHAVFPDRPWLCQEPKLAEDKHGRFVPVQSPFSVSDRRAFSDLIEMVEPLKSKQTERTVSERELIRLHARLVDCVLQLERNEAPIMERFGERS